METKELLTKIETIAVNNKANEPLIIDFEGRSAYTDYLLIVHGNSSTHNQGIAEQILFQMKEVKELPLGIEGMQQGEWILLDYNTVIVHIFTSVTREKYDFEKLFQNYLKIKREDHPQ